MNVNAINVPDGITLQTANVAAPGIGASINTTGYKSVTISVTGSEACNLVIQGSNDGSNWQPLLLVATDSFDIVDTIQGNGIYSLRVSSLYVQYNCSQIIGSLSMIVIGRAGLGASAVEKLALAMNPEANFPLQVNLLSGLRTDSNKAVILSDAPAPIPLSGNVGTAVLIDTTGYQSLQLTTQALAGTVTTSTDGVTFVALTGTAVGALATTNTIAANTVYAFPCLSRWIKIAITTAGTATAILRATPYLAGYANNSPINVSQIGSTAVVNGGVAGLLGVGGNIAAGVAPTANPVPIGGVDSSNLTRRLLTDTSGRVQVGLAPNSAVTIAANTTPVQTIYNTNPFNVQDTTQSDGNLVIDLLSQILLELRIANQQAYEFNMGAVPRYEDPSVYRNDPSMFSS